MIELQQVHKQYPNGFYALMDINLTIQAGEILGIVGKSGAGKSTLLRCFNLLERPTQGQVKFNGTNLLNLNTHQLRQARFKLGMIFQEFNLLTNKTSHDNVALSLRIQGLAYHQTKIDELLDLVELSDKANFYPSQLSGGQKQRLSIARALATSPQVLLCDEITSALDPQTTSLILTLLKKINKLAGITIILISHELDVIKQIADHIIIVENGKIVDDLPAHQLFLKEGKAKQLFLDHLLPSFPDYFKTRLTEHPTSMSYPLIKLCFYEKTTLHPFISQLSRELNISINILQANINAIDSSIGIIIAELQANEREIALFLIRCQQEHITVEILGYVPSTNY